MGGKANIRFTEKWHSCAGCVAFLRIQYKTFSNTFFFFSDCSDPAAKQKDFKKFDLTSSCWRIRGNGEQSLCGSKIICLLSRMFAQILFFFLMSETPGFNSFHK